MPKSKNKNKIIEPKVNVNKESTGSFITDRIRRNFKLYYQTCNLNDFTYIYAIVTIFKYSYILVYISCISIDEWRDILTERVNPSDFLSTMARHENDIIIIEKCCVVVGNLVLSGTSIANIVSLIHIASHLVMFVHPFYHNQNLLIQN